MIMFRYIMFYDYVFGALCFMITFWCIMFDDYV